MLHPVSSLKKYHIVSTDGHIGHIKDVYFDSHEWTVRYLVVRTGAWLLGKEVLIPARALGLINVEEASIHVNLTLEKIKDAPDSDTARPVSRQEDIVFHEYYGFPPGVEPWVALHTPTMTAFGTAQVMQTGPEPASLVNRPVAAERGDPHLRSVHDVTGHTICGSDQEIGRVGDFLVDDHDWSIRYFIVNTAVWFGKEVVVPTAAIREVSWDERTVYLTIPREEVKNAPEFDADAPRVELDQQRLAEYYSRQRKGA
jgi:sporulation protein YlmC with PRC-barrel domain